MRTHLSLGRTRTRTPSEVNTFLNSRPGHQRKIFHVYRPRRDLEQFLAHIGTFGVFQMFLMNRPEMCVCVCVCVFLFCPFGILRPFAMIPRSSTCEKMSLGHSHSAHLQGNFKASFSIGREKSPFSVWGRSLSPRTISEPSAGFQLIHARPGPARQRQQRSLPLRLLIIPN